VPLTPAADGRLLAIWTTYPRRDAIRRQRISLS
jgi:hypothetical protein